MELITAGIKNGALELPNEVLTWLKPDDRLMFYIEGDTLILKKVNPLRLSELADRISTDVEIPLQEIVDEVHRYREEKRHALEFPSA
ncbi:MAG: hypothetical protein AB1791_13785 [Chloroflexota bacterium]